MASLAKMRLSPFLAVIAIGIVIFLSSTAFAAGGTQRSLLLNKAMAKGYVPMVSGKGGCLPEGRKYKAVVESGSRVLLKPSASVIRRNKRTLRKLTSKCQTLSIAQSTVLSYSVVNEAGFPLAGLSALSDSNLSLPLESLPPRFNVVFHTGRLTKGILVQLGGNLIHSDSRSPFTLSAQAIVTESLLGVLNVPLSFEVIVVDSKLRQSRPFNLTLSITGTPGGTPTVTSTPTATNSPTATPTVRTPTATPTATPRGTNSPVPTATPTSTPTSRPTTSPTPSAPRGPNDRGIVGGTSNVTSQRSVLSVNLPVLPNDARDIQHGAKTVVFRNGQTRERGQLIPFNFLPAPEGGVLPNSYKAFFASTLLGSASSIETYREMVWSVEPASGAPSFPSLSMPTEVASFLSQGRLEVRISGQSSSDTDYLARLVGPVVPGSQQSVTLVSSGPLVAIYRLSATAVAQNTSAHPQNSWWTPIVIAYLSVPLSSSNGPGAFSLDLAIANNTTNGGGVLFTPQVSLNVTTASGAPAAYIGRRHVTFPFQPREFNFDRPGSTPGTYYLLAPGQMHRLSQAHINFEDLQIALSNSGVVLAAEKTQSRDRFVSIIEDPNLPTTAVRSDFLTVGTSEGALPFIQHLTSGQYLADRCDAIAAEGFFGNNRLYARSGTFPVFFADAMSMGGDEGFYGHAPELILATNTRSAAVGRCIDALSIGLSGFMNRWGGSMVWEPDGTTLSITEAQSRYNVGNSLWWGEWTSLNSTSTINPDRDKGALPHLAALETSGRALVPDRAAIESYTLSTNLQHTSREALAANQVAVVGSLLARDVWAAIQNVWVLAQFGTGLAAELDQWYLDGLSHRCQQQFTMRDKGGLAQNLARYVVATGDVSSSLRARVNLFTEALLLHVCINQSGLITLEGPYLSSDISNVLSRIRTVMPPEYWPPSEAALGDPLTGGRRMSWEGPWFATLVEQLYEIIYPSPDFTWEVSMLSEAFDRHVSASIDICGSGDDRRSCGLYSSASGGDAPYTMLYSLYNYNTGQQVILSTAQRQQLGDPNSGSTNYLQIGVLRYITKYRPDLMPALGRLDFNYSDYSSAINETWALTAVASAQNRRGR
ncbi:MAG: hypothetical protein K1X79_11280 [Oligoflexia bacterium]|nr:hypothetical protein [Oligoflexia bacterium]